MINVKEIVDEWKEDLKTQINKRVDLPHIIIYQVGNRPDSNSYIKGKLNDCKKLGIGVEHKKFDENVSFDEVYETIKVDRTHLYNQMLQLPVPFDEFETQRLLDLIPENQDPDALSTASKSLGKLPCTPKGIMELFKRCNVNLNGKNVVIINRSDVVGAPLSKAMLDEDATVTICHSKTDKKLIKELCLIADIVVVAVGVPNFLTKDMVRPDTFIVDVGINRGEDGKLCGDCDKELYDYVENITPTPKGVGILTRCALLDSIINK